MAAHETTGTQRMKTKEEIDHLVAELMRARDQVRLELHLAGMEAKEKYAKIEKEIFEVEQAAKRATEDTVRDVKERLKDLRVRLEGLRERVSVI